MSAAYSGHKEAMEVLLKYGADVNAKNKVSKPGVAEVGSGWVRRPVVYCCWNKGLVGISCNDNNFRHR